MAPGHTLAPKQDDHQLMSPVAILMPSQDEVASTASTIQTIRTVSPIASRARRLRKNAKVSAILGEVEVVSKRLLNLLAEGWVG